MCQGKEVYGNWKNGGLYYRGIVTRRSGDDIRIRYDDGDVEDTTIAMIRLRAQRDIHRLPSGSPVFGLWTDGLWYPAVLQGAKEGRYEILYHDGVRQFFAEDQIVDWHVTVGDQVEVDWLGRGGYWRAEVTRLSNNKYPVEYEDGSTETTTIRYIRTQFKRVKR